MKYLVILQDLNALEISLFTGSLPPIFALCQIKYLVAKYLIWHNAKIGGKEPVKSEISKAFKSCKITKYFKDQFYGSVLQGCHVLELNEKWDESLLGEQMTPEKIEELKIEHENLEEKAAMEQKIKREMDEKKEIDQQPAKKGRKTSRKKLRKKKMKRKLRKKKMKKIEKEKDEKKVEKDEKKVEKDELELIFSDVEEKIEVKKKDKKEKKIRKKKRRKKKKIRKKKKVKRIKKKS